MPTYVSMLRGINVSGQKLIKMGTLKKLYEALGFENVITYVQSGNVVFKSENQNSTLLEQILSDKIKDDFGYEVFVFVMTVEQLNNIVMIISLRVRLGIHPSNSLARSLEAISLAGSPGRRGPIEKLTGKCSDTSSITCLTE